MISYWKLDEASGDAIDAYGSNDGTVTGATYGATGKINDAYDFDGTNDKIDLGEPANLDFTTESFTISAWVYVKGNPWSHRPVVNKGDTQYALKLSGSNYFEFVCYDSTWQGASSNSSFNEDQWYFIVGRKSGTEVALWVDGVKQTDTDTVGTLNNTSYNVGIGWDSQNSRWFNGTIDEVGIWDRALTQAEITELYNSGDGLAYPFGWAVKIQGITPGKVQSIAVADISKIQGVS